MLKKLMAALHGEKLEKPTVLVPEPPPALPDGDDSLIEKKAKPDG